MKAGSWSYPELQELAESFLEKKIDRPDAEARLARVEWKSCQRKARGAICLDGVDLVHATNWIRPKSQTVDQG